MTLDDTLLRDLFGFSDELGVLSFYAGYTPASAADPQPTAPIEVRNAIRDLRARLADTDPALAKAVDERIGTLDGQLDELLDPRASGRGRALFVGVASGESRTVRTRLPFRERVVHHEGPFLRPLVAALDEGRPAGVLVVSRSGARLLRWAVGEVEELGTSTFELTDAQLADVGSGPSPAHPQLAGRGHVARERFEDRIDDNLHRFLKDVVGDLVRRAQDEHWDRLVVAGPPKLRDEVRDLVERELPAADGRARVLVAEQAWEDTGAHVIADQLWPLFRSVRRESEDELVAAAIERAMAGGPGAVGMRHVCDALNEGRVAQLLYDDGLQVSGHRSEEGTLHPRVEGVVATSDLRLRPEPLFVERMVEKAFATSARVTPVEPDAAEPLRAHEGVAALLRW